MDYSDLKILDNPTLVRDFTLDKLRDAISTGLYPPGTRLVERELCEALGVSRTSVREALRQLQSENLLEIGKRRNISVAIVTSKDASDIYLLRDLLESLAIRRFAELANDKEIKKIVKVHKDLKRAAVKGNIHELAGMAGEFYDTILLGARSKVIYEVARQLLTRVNYLRMRSMSEPGRLDDGLQEWASMVDAIQARDPDRAAEAMSAHLRNARNVLVARLQAEEAEAAPLAET